MTSLSRDVFLAFIASLRAYIGHMLYGEAPAPIISSTGPVAPPLHHYTVLLCAYANYD